MLVPSPSQLPETALRKACVIKDNFGSLAPLLQFKSHQRIEPGLPGGGTPRLNDPLSRNQLHISSDDQATEQRKCPSGVPIDLGRRTSKSGKLLRIQQRLVNMLTTRPNIDLLMEICEQAFGSRALRLLHAVLIRLSLPPNTSDGDQPTERRDHSSNQFPPCWCRHHCARTFFLRHHSSPA